VNTIVARSEEVKILDKLMETSEPNLLAIYGRRRIGKTYLISRYFAGKGIYFELTGSDKLKASQQLINFMAAFKQIFPDSDFYPPPKDWLEALHQLREEVEKIPTSKKVILFFDELPWLSKQNSGFLAALEFFWNRYMSRRENVIVVICGSAAAWMIKHVISDKGGMHGRVTKKIHLQPFSLAETEEFLQSRNIRLAKKEIIELYMAIGGVAKYLTYIESGKSTAQMINEMCFNRNGDLFNEFELLYRSLFKGYESHLKIIRALASAPTGLTKNELLEKAGLKSGGSSSQFIEELVKSDFIIYSLPFGNKVSNGVYILIDEYSLFYLRWIEPIAKQGAARLDPNYWLKQKTSPAWPSWTGHAFEAICHKHILPIKRALGISAVATMISGWRYRSDGTDDSIGAQIDLVIDRADACINLCEIKFNNKEFLITSDYAEQLVQKKLIFQKMTKSKKTLFMTMITSYGVAKNDYFRQVIDGGEITIEDLFK
jgi:AAA+ ATPase superfamily predicted ATPase